MAEKSKDTTSLNDSQDSERSLTAAMTKQLDLSKLAALPLWPNSWTSSSMKQPESWQNSWTSANLWQPKP